MSSFVYKSLTKRYWNWITRWDTFAVIGAYRVIGVYKNFGQMLLAFICFLLPIIPIFVIDLIWNLGRVITYFFVTPRNNITTSDIVGIENITPELTAKQTKRINELTIKLITTVPIAYKKYESLCMELGKLLMIPGSVGAVYNTLKITADQFPVPSVDEWLTDEEMFNRQSPMHIIIDVMKHYISRERGAHIYIWIRSLKSVPLVQELVALVLDDIRSTDEINHHCGVIFAKKLHGAIESFDEDLEQIERIRENCESICSTKIGYKTGTNDDNYVSEMKFATKWHQLVVQSMAKLEKAVYKACPSLLESDRELDD